MQDSPAPFFARFLEAQDYPQVQSDVKAGPGGTTNPTFDLMHTMKYPSDDDEGGWDAS